MLARLFKTNDFVQKPGDKFRYVYFIMDGNVSICTAKAKFPVAYYGSNSWFGDYQVLFNKKCNYSYKCEEIAGPMKVFARNAIPAVNDKPNSTNKTFFFMCIEAKTLMSLVELYP